MFFIKFFQFLSGKTSCWKCLWHSRKSFSSSEKSNSPKLHKLSQDCESCSCASQLPYSEVQQERTISEHKSTKERRRKWSFNSRFLGRRWKNKQSWIIEPAGRQQIRHKKSKRAKRLHGKCHAQWWPCSVAVSPRIENYLISLRRNHLFC